MIWLCCQFLEKIIISEKRGKKVEKKALHVKSNCNRKVLNLNFGIEHRFRVISS